MSTPIVSIIIPAYNTRHYIAEMLKSIFVQTYKNIQIIVIDDGSTDGTAEVVLQVGKFFSFTSIELIRIQNGGVSNARNVGLKHAVGHYVLFWDSDDTMEPFAVEHLVHFAQENNVNAVMFGYSNKVNGIKGNAHVSSLSGIYRGIDIVKCIVPLTIGHSFDDVNAWIKGKCSMRHGKEHSAMWRMMCCRKTIVQYNLKFDTNLSLGEDTRFMNEYLLCEDTIGYFDECLYYLTIRENGANRTSIRNAAKRLSDKLKLVNVRCEIDTLAKKRYSINIHVYWEGTLAFSAIELAIRMAKNPVLSLKNNYRLYKDYMSNEIVKKAVYDFHPALGIKAVPFFLLKWFGASFIFYCMMCVPNFVIKKIIN